MALREAERISGIDWIVGVIGAVAIAALLWVAIA
jgi:hypothetical protein